MQEARADAGGSWLAQLRQRHVAAWVLGYLAGGFALLQGIDLVSPHFGWPAAAMRIATAAVVGGVPIVAVLAWYHGARGDQPPVRAELAWLLVLGLGALGFIGWVGNQHAPEASPSKLPERARAAELVAEASDSAPGVADAATPVLGVLPLQPIDTTDAVFADGLHDELISRLYTLQGVDVISRTSMLAFRDRTRGTRAIAAELGASHLLEGTVQRAGDEVRLRVALVDARRDRQLFSRALASRLTDVFESQALIAAEIAEALRLTLSAGSRAELERRPTPVAEAYEAYLAARAARRDMDNDRALELLDQALAADPAFFDARALAAWIEARRSIHAVATEVPALAARAREHRDRLLQIAPEHPLTDLAVGTVAYWVEQDLAAGRAALQRTLAQLPSETAALHTLAWIANRQGRHAEAEALFRRLMEIESDSKIMFDTVGLHALFSRDYRRALALAQAAERADPADLNLRFNRADMQYLLSGEVAPLREAAAATPPGPGRLEREILLANAEGNTAALRELLPALPELFSLSLFRLYAPKALYQAMVEPDAHASGLLLSAASELLQSVAAAKAGHPALTAWQGWILALRGQRSEAVQHLERARQASDAHPDQMFRAGLTVRLAIGYALVGDGPRTAETLRRCLSLYSGCHRQDLLHSALWIPARRLPEVESLLQQLALAPNQRSGE